MAAQSYYNSEGLTAPKPSGPYQQLYGDGNGSSMYRSDSTDIHQSLEEDQALKARIRRLRLISRIVGLLLAIATLVTQALTLHKFLTTRHTRKAVSRSDGSMIRRTPWHQDSKVWPTYMYFSVAAVTVILYLITLISYKKSVKAANKATYVTTTFTWVVMAGNLIVWIVAASLYRKEKKVDDLWGWTCSDAARAIQGIFEDDVDFKTFCNVQSVSWYTGLAQIAAILLTIVILFLVVMRKKSKRELKSFGLEQVTK
ncbi:hypothetical protein M501DRAFT_1019489 [Patellaria atrata CBS 101060]|uniref:MARVEL domain-containing protein n=1 Tax=Patellaria atrata CBS 101060 TaxID=1346257 RepID=A0A9P4VK15_9PEZI|nr:hypothetical protein M501DRAFT_1019489 [Patellaria atrata CBS 101060]